MKTYLIVHIDDGVVTGAGHDELSFPLFPLNDQLEENAQAKERTLGARREFGQYNKGESCC